MITRWYRTSVFYSVDVGLFQDSNDDRAGDFRGPITWLDYRARPRGFDSRGDGKRGVYLGAGWPRRPVRSSRTW